ncbi:MAG: FAD binding domain-containing protein [Nitrososphaerota archaeon]|nr:FAD binding domain-containing protein [Nitrososphaerota archaeon]
MLEKYGDRAAILGGGTLIHSLASRGLLTQIDTIIQIQDLGLSYIRIDDSRFRIGATTTFAEIEANSYVSNDPSFGALKDALKYPPVQIRNTATIGGSIASAFPLFDIPIALLALSADARIRGPNHEREIGLESLCVDYFQTTLSKGEFITEVALPLLRNRSFSAFLKLETNANDLAIINVSVNLSFDSSDDSICSDARIFVGGGIGKVPVRALSAEAQLRGKAFDKSLLDKASQAIEFDVTPIEDHRASSKYRLVATKVLLKRALTQVLNRSRQPSPVGKLRNESNGSTMMTEYSSVLSSTVILEVNGKSHRLELGPCETLLDVLRERLGLSGAKRGCDTGGCGCCTVLVNNRAVYSCMTYALSLNGKQVTTIEGLIVDGRMDPIQEAFVKVGAVQCGYCTSGMIMNAKSLLLSEKSPSEEQIRKSISGNLCRCTGYQKIVEAVMMASKNNQ